MLTDADGVTSCLSCGQEHIGASIDTRSVPKPAIRPDAAPIGPDPADWVDLAQLHVRNLVDRATNAEAERMAALHEASKVLHALRAYGLTDLPKLPAYDRHAPRMKRGHYAPRLAPAGAPANSAHD